MERFAAQKPLDVRAAVTAAQIKDMQAGLGRVYYDRKLEEYILDVVLATRKSDGRGLHLEPYIEYGASPRATLHLNLASRAKAMLLGRSYATPQDVKDVAHDVLRHRIILSYEAEAEGVSTDDVIARILNGVPVP